MGRLTAVLGVSVVLVMLLSIAPTAFGSPAATLSPLPGVASPQGLPSVSPASQNCSSYGGIGLNFGVVGISNGSQGRVGLAPATVNFSANISGPPGNYTYSLSYGDGVITNGSYIQNLTAARSLVLTHVYTFPAFYNVNFEVDSTCSSGNGSSGFGAGEGISIQVEGPGGYNPVTVTANVTNGTVPLAVRLQAVVNDSPTNASLVWFIYSAAGAQIFTNVTSLNLTFRSPGLVFPEVVVTYPSSSIEYGVGLLSAGYLAVLPLVDVNVTQSRPIATANSTTITFFANTTSLNGTPYTGPGNTSWSFSTPGFLGNNSTPLVVRSGPVTGNEVTETFTPGLPGANEYLGMFVTAGFVDPAGNTLGLGQSYFTIVFGNAGSGSPGIGLYLNASPSIGNSPFSTNLTFQSTPDPLPASPPPVNATIAYELEVCVAPSSLGWNSSCPTFSDNISNWSGGPTTVPVTGLSAGTYLVVGNLWQAGPNGSRIFLAAANATLNVGSAGATGGPLTATVTGSPATGTAPLATSLGVQAIGGTAPYDLSVCVRGPLASPSGAGTCNAVASLAGWNGTTTTIPLSLNQSGYYVAVATVTDTSGNASAGSATFNVSAPAVAAPLEVQASGHPASSPGAYTFTATIQGGVAPYDVQWAFGDGTFGASTPGGTVAHSYLASGSYTATLTVTDARGTVKTSNVGPLLVTLPTSSGTSLLSGWSLGLVTASLLVILVSLVALAYVARTAMERRRTQAWLDSLESAPPSEQPPSNPGR
jgi:PKD repeat protein